MVFASLGTNKRILVVSLPFVGVCTGPSHVMPVLACAVMPNWRHLCNEVAQGLETHLSVEEFGAGRMLSFQAPEPFGFCSLNSSACLP